ncbi:response regulator transcription factor [Sphingomonas sp. RB3P16]|uniref:response regulator transcription factor n=1 Tax=Parasphingomonas frigoris TaxID=3096163 RepID=UPI002FCB261D
MARIIMADDDEIVAEIAIEALNAAGHAVGLLADGTDMMKVIRDRKPDLVILDCNMPEKNGIIVLREMRNTTEFYDTPVLILTGRRGERDVELAMYEGANDYMKKPFDPDELVFRVSELLEKRRIAMALRPTQ